MNKCNFQKGVLLAPFLKSLGKNWVCEKLHELSRASGQSVARWALHWVPSQLCRLRHTHPTHLESRGQGSRPRLQGLRQASLCHLTGFTFHCRESYLKERIGKITPFATHPLSWHGNIVSASWHGNHLLHDREGPETRT